MTELFLIAHKVRGERGFDIAQQLICPICDGRSSQKYIDGPMFCAACEETGYWWVIPTSGHRAYPYWYCDLDDMFVDCDPPPMPADLRDHYAVTIIEPAGKPAKATPSLDDL